MRIILFFSILLISLVSSAQVPDWTDTTDTKKPKKYNMHTLLANNNVVILDFSAMWCPPCQSTVPALDSLYITYKEGNSCVKIFEFLIQNNSFNTTDSLDLDEWETKFNLSIPGFYNCMPTYTDYSNLYGSSIPLILMFLPDTNNPANSTLVYNYISGLGVTSRDSVYSDMLSILEENGYYPKADREELIVFPNPTSDIICLNNVKKKSAFFITDFSGKRVLDGYISEDENTINLNSFKAGIYLLFVDHAPAIKIVKN